jgi:hypothetical protein
MTLHLHLVGVLCLLLALAHIGFPRYFNWPEEFSRVSLINRQMMYVHTFFIGLIVFLIGLLCLTSATDLIQTQLGRRIALGLFCFWFTRFVFQLAVYSPRLWRGKRFETVVHIAFTGLWSYISWVFFLVWRHS